MNTRIILSTVILALSQTVWVRAAELPNVVIIYSDDQGALDANCYGSTDLVTPAIDRLAATGVRFTNMYAPSAICSSSRAGLMTGRFPARAGVAGNVSSQHGEAGMPTTEVTIAELLQQAGYVTGHVGKWHLGYTPETMPNGQGFAESFGHMGGCIDNYSHFFYWQGPNRHDLWRNGVEIWEDGRYFPDLMVDECRTFIDRNRTRPFFLYWAINMPHYPMQGTEKWRAHYRHLEAPRRMYAEFISTMDEKIGAVVDHLEQAGLRERTLIIFQSDHGYSTEERAFFGGGNAGHLRGAKGCLFEGGMRVPSIASWPGTLPQHEVRDQQAFGCDWFPTIAELTGTPLPDHHLDGRSLADVLRKNASTPHQQLFWQLGNGDRAQFAVRQGPWKLLVNPRDTSNRGKLTDDDTEFLANLELDETESRNLARDYPEELKQLQHLLKKFRSELGN